MGKKKPLLIALMFALAGLLMAVPSFGQNVWNGWSGANDYTDPINRNGWLSVGNQNSIWGPIGMSSLEVNTCDDVNWAGFLYNCGGSGQGLRIKGGYPPWAIPLLQIEANSTDASAPNYPYDVENVRMVVLANGNVGIGTTTPSQLLVVNGMMCAQEVHISLNADPCTFPDYVFAKDYKLAPLSDLKNYLLQNKHLPEMPTANEAAKNGMEVGAMQVELLKKMEELTLYVIKLQEENDALKKKVEAVNRKVNTLAAKN